jgi:4-hydroxybutyryl-CoA dehydratase/vinylacetyl-CoA-Delta-isomerase
MAGEWEFSRFVARTFGTFLRATEVGHAPEELELYAGAAQLITEMNGLTGIRPIKEKINEIATTSQLLALLRTAAISKSEIIEGVALPDPLATNLLKLYYSEGLARAMAILAEISGGGVVTAPTAADFENPETGALARKYWQGAGGVDGESRVKVFKLIYDLVASESAGYHNILMLQGGGSPGVARAMAASTFDMPKAVQRAREAAGLDGAS